MKYYIFHNNENHGPLEIREMEEYGLNPASLVWADGWPDWRNAGDVPEIQAYLEKTETEAREKRETPPPPVQQYTRNTAEAYTGTTPPPPPGTIAEPLVCEDKDIEWYIAVNNREVGPVKESRLIGLGLAPDSLVWHDRLTNWTPASEVKELERLLSQAKTSITPNQEIYVTQNGNDKIPGYIWSILSAILTAAVIAVTIANSRYYSTGDVLKLILVCAGAPLSLTIVSFVFYLLGKSDSVKNQAFKSGISLGASCGAVIAAAAGLCLAVAEFEII